MANGAGAERHDDERTTQSNELTSVDVETLLRQRVAPRRRALQVVSVASVVLLVVGIILWRVVPVAPFRTASAPPRTSEPGTAMIVSDVTYGTVTVNGRAVGGLPRAVTLPVGHSTLTVSAAPFLPHSCTVEWTAGKPSPRSTCAIEYDAQGVTINGQLIDPEIFVGVLVTADDLPPDLRRGALDVVAQLLASVSLETTVPAGQYFATGGDPQALVASQRAGAPLRAKLVAFPDDAPAGIARRDCGGLRCAQQIYPGEDRAGHFWAVREAIGIRWQFTDASGALVGSITFRLPLPLLLTLSFDAAAGWQVVDTPEFRMRSLAAELDVCSAGAELLLEHVWTNEYYTTALRAQPVEGCALRLENTVGNSLGIFIWRFGVLLAADAQAHATLPSLPVASPEETHATGW